MGAEVGSNLRERKQRAVRDAVADAAVTLFVAQGYDATTVGEIAAQSGMSPRTFFRYFAGKDEVITHTFATIGEGIAAALSRRPSGEAPWTALRRAFDVLLEQMDSDERVLVIMQIVHDTPALYARYLEKQTRWRAGITAVLLERSRSDGAPIGDRDRLEAESLAGAAISSFEVACSAWASSAGTASFGSLLDVTMAAVCVPDGGCSGAS